MASASWVNGWVTGDVVTAAEYRKSVGCVFDSTLGVAAAAIDTLAIIPASYAHMRVVAVLRGDTAATTVAPLVRVNNDSGGNYDEQNISGGSTSVAGAETFAGSSWSLGVLPAASDTAGIAGHLIIDFPNYAATTFQKTIDAKVAHKSGTSSGNMTAYTYIGFWRSTSAISRVSITAAAGNWLAGSRMSVYVWGS